MISSRPWSENKGEWECDGGGESGGVRGGKRERQSRERESESGRVREVSARVGGKRSHLVQDRGDREDEAL